MKRKNPSSLQLNAYIKCKKLKLKVPEIIVEQIEGVSATKIQKAYRKHLGFINICENIQNIPLTKKTLYKAIWYGLHLDNEKRFSKINDFQGLYELRLILNKLVINFIKKSPSNLNLGLSENQLKDILKIFNKDQLLVIGYGLDSNRMSR